VALPGARPTTTPLLRRLLHKADFVSLLEVSARERSAHFAIHHVASIPSPSSERVADRSPTRLSTNNEEPRSQPVDNLPEAIWIGCVVPKRHARRSVTRSLLKRQIRCAFERHAAGLPRGLWLVRLRSTFALQAFASAASGALKEAARDELDALLARTVAAA
jgi:ribonuclease P protein component